MPPGQLAEFWPIPSSRTVGFTSSARTQMLELIALQSGKGLASLEKPRSHPARDRPGELPTFAPYFLHIQHLRGFDHGGHTVALPMIVLP